MSNTVSNKTSSGSKSAKVGKLSQKALLKRKQQQQQLQTMIVLGIGIVILAVILIYALFPRSTATVSSGRYANLPTGTTVTGPTSAQAYPYDAPYLGNPNAPAKIEEIGSFSCPICLAYHDSVFINLIDEIQAGRLQYIFLPTTLTGDYDSVPGTEAAYCAMQQGQFWPMHDRLFQEQSEYGSDAARIDHIEADAQSLNLDMTKFDACKTSAQAQQFVQTANSYADQRGMRGTPTIFLFINGQQVQPTATNPNLTPGSVNAMSLPDLRQAIESAKAS